jgi:hypothetical protein
MSSALRGTEGDDSKGLAALPSRFPGAIAVRAALTVAAAAGAVLLVAATFATVIDIKVGTTSRLAGTDPSHSGWDRHGPALLLLAVLAVGLLGAALRGARAAMAGVAAAGIAALAIAMIWDRPHVHDTGSVGELYAGATANPASGYYFETLGGALLLLSGGGLLVLASAGRSGRRRAAEAGAADSAEPAEPEPERAPG